MHTNIALFIYIYIYYLVKSKVLTLLSMVLTVNLKLLIRVCEVYYVDGVLC